MNAEKWRKLSFAIQMGNIGSEFNRAVYWSQRKNEEEKKTSLWRILELLDLTIMQRKSVELLRLREIICDLFLENREYNVSEKKLKNYFIQFALLANK